MFKQKRWLLAKRKQIPQDDTTGQEIINGYIESLEELQTDHLLEMGTTEELQAHCDGLILEFQQKAKHTNRTTNSSVKFLQEISENKRWMSFLKQEMTANMRDHRVIIEAHEKEVKEFQRCKAARQDYRKEIEEQTEALPRKKSRLTQIEDEIEEMKLEIQELTQNISYTRHEITLTENQNRLLQHRKPPTISEYEIADDEVPEFNEEHEEILRQKRNMIAPIKQELSALTNEREALEAQFNLLVEETDDFEAEIIELTETINSMNTQGDEMHNECQYIQDQITERTNEIRSLERLKREGEVAYAQLQDRAKNFESIDGGKLDIEKTIVSLQTQLRRLIAEINEVNMNMKEASDANDAYATEALAKQTQFEGAVDWQTERDELKRELDELNEQIREKKTKLTKKEQKNDTRHANLSKYAPLLKKWKGKTANIEVPEDKTVSQLWAELTDAREKSEELQESAEREIGDLVTRNAKLEEELNRKKASLERTISQAYAEENQLRKRIEERRTRAEAEEKKLLQQIQEAKLKLAQKQLMQLRK